MPIPTSAPTRPPVKLSLPVAGAEQLRLRGRLRPRPRHGRPRDLGQRPPLSPRTAQAGRDGASRRTACSPTDAEPSIGSCDPPYEHRRPWTTDASTVLVRSSGWLSASLVCPRRRDPDVGIRTTRTRTRESPIEVYEWSIWVGNPAQTSLNATRHLQERDAQRRSARAGRSSKTRSWPIKFPIAPISVVQFFGEPCKDVDVDLRAKKGLPLALAGEHRARGPAPVVQVGPLTPARPPTSRRAICRKPLAPEAPRQTRPPCSSSTSRISSGSSPTTPSWRSPIPVKIRGGPDEYTFQNLTSRRLLDVAVIAPTDAGFRVGWLDELPTAAPEKKTSETRRPRRRHGKKTAKKKKAETPEQKAEAVFDEAEAGREEEEGQGGGTPPLPAEGDATVKARVDQLLNRPVAVTVEQGPATGGARPDRRPGPAPVRARRQDAGQGADRPGSADEPEGRRASRPATRWPTCWATIGLSYRVTEDGKLFITTAARLAEDADKKGERDRRPAGQARHVASR